MVREHPLYSETVDGIRLLLLDQINEALLNLLEELINQIIIELSDQRLTGLVTHLLLCFSELVNIRLLLFHFAFALVLDQVHQYVF